MADLSLTVDVSSLTQAKTKLKDFQNQMSKSNSVVGLTRAVGTLENQISELVRAQEKGRIGAGAYNKGLLELKRQYEQLGYSSQQATRAVRDYARQLQNQRATEAAQRAARELAEEQRRVARAAEEAAAAHQRTRERLIPGAAAAARLREAQRDLSAAYRAGVINIDEYRAALIRLNTVNRGAQAGTNNLGVAMQQTGYQVGDFAVQIQSGTDPLVAFGQQATQLVGVLYLLPPATLAARTSIAGLTVSVGALVAALGIAIPVISGLLLVIKRARGEARNFEDSLDKLKSSVSDLTNTQELLAMSVDDLEEKYGAAAEAVRQYALVEAQLNASLARDQMSKSVTGLADLTEQFASSSTGGRELRNTIEDVTEAFQVSNEDAQTLVNTFQSMQEAMGFEDQKSAVDDLLASFEQMGISLQSLPTDVQKMVVQFIQANYSVAEANNLISQLESGITRAENETRRTAEAADDLEDRLELAARQAAFLSGIDMASGVAAAASQAAILANNLGIAFSQAYALATLQGNMGNQGSGGLGFGGDSGGTGNPFIDGRSRGIGGEITNRTPPGMTTGSNLADILSSGDILPPQSLDQMIAGIGAGSGGGGGGGGGGSGGGGSGGQSFGEMYRELKKANSAAREMIGVFGARKEALQEISKMEKALQRNLSETERMKVENALKEKQRIESISEALGTMQSNLEDAFVSVVDGSKSVKDAFSDMLRNILLEIYKQQIAKPAAENIVGLLGGAARGILGGGSDVPSFAGGGFTGAGPRAGGLDGKGGFMAMLHPNEVVMDRTRGQSGSVNVTQVFNIQGNGDEYLEAKIRQAAPSISKATKAEILNERRRGGVYRSTFG